MGVCVEVSTYEGGLVINCVLEEVRISSVSVSAVDVDLGGMYTLVSVRVFLVEICMLIIWASTVCC